jgi:Flp pilus assembly protein TadD
MPPGDAIARIFQQAHALHRAGRLAPAEAGYRQVLALDPRHADSLNFLGVIAAQGGRHAEAVERIGQAIGLRPKVADYHDNLGLALMALGRLDEAGNCHRKALRLDPNHANAHNHFGNVLTKRGRTGEAERSYRAALRIDPDHVEAHNNLGVALTDLEQPEAAEPHFRAALRLDPAYTDAYANLGSALRNLGRVAEAEAALRAGLDLAPDSVVLRYNLAGLLLLTGRFEAGWRCYEERRRLATAPPLPAVPQWRGEPIGDRVLLLQAEQGAGDTLFACRYLRHFSPGTRLLLEVPQALSRLLQGQDGPARLLDRGEPLPHVDLHCPLMSLPLAFGTSRDSIPGNVPYLAADPPSVAAWRRRLAPLPGLRVGLVWAGAPGHAEDRRRSMSPALLGPLGAVEGVSFVSLQKGRDGAPPIPLTDWTAELRDFADTAALITALDLVIGVDTAVIHLAGALAKPVWLLNRFDPHWLWLQDRGDSPWYPTLRQFRQDQPGDWASVISAVALALALQRDRLTMAAIQANGIVLRKT